MEVGEKYIIEISDVVTTNNGNLAKIKGFNALVFDENGLNKLECLSTDYIDRGKAEAEKSDACAEAQLSGRAMGHDEGYKEGYDEAKKVWYKLGYDEGKADALKEFGNVKPHEPQIGDIYKLIDGTKAIIFSMDKFPDNYYFKDADALKGIFGYKYIMEHFEFVENRKDLIDTLKGALA